jgi:D-beta-D-heptose 7-phosphate kinase/D-beta-D-heptose 1-phosphate adenosyltransferase
MIGLKRLDEILRAFSGKAILVYGDIILDRYIFGTVGRISPEAPVPVVKVSREEFRLGGAGNGAANISRLGAEAILLGVSGDDIFADELMKLKATHNRMIRTKENHTIVKTRVISGRQQIVRIDREESILLGADADDKIIQEIKAAHIHGILISDYGKGTLTARVMAALKEKSGRDQIPLIVDPKPPNFHLYSHITGITPNQTEAEGITRREIEDNEASASAARSIQRKFQADFCLITRGSMGMTAAQKGKKTFHLPAYGHEVFDVTGAGDTVAAVLTLSLVSGADLKEAAFLANAAASIVIEKIGAAPVSPDELHRRIAFLLKNKK